MAACPFHGGDICSLCCSLETRCQDLCRPDGPIDRQAAAFSGRFLPSPVIAFLGSRYGAFMAITGAFSLVIGLMLLMIHHNFSLAAPESAAIVGQTLIVVFGLLVVVVGVAAWLHALAQHSRRLANEERERQAARLTAEIRAHERTNDELQRAKEAAEAANHAKSRYVVGMSHELRTPLNALLGFAQLLENDPTLPAHRRHGAKVIRRSSEHLADLIESLLDISKIEANRFELARVDTAFRELVEQMAAVFRHDAEKKGLSFAFETGELPVRVWADDRRVRQILMNLLSNAVRYTDRGAVRFSVRFRSDVATFVVEDTGRGIPQHEQERIFQPFERIEDPSAPPVRGTGLGLTISRLLVETLGGELTLESTPRIGSRFTARLMLPRIVGAAPAELKRRLYGYRGRRLMILVVDDNAEHRQLIEDALRPLGFLLTLAESGEAALAAVAAAPPDLALLDVSMPGMTGWALAARLRSEYRLTVPIIMVSAHAEDARGSQRIAYHDDFLFKPVKLDLLFARLEHHLRLVWLTEQPQAAIPIRPKAPATAAARIGELIEIGHVRGIERVLADIPGDDPAVAAFLESARRRLGDVDLDGLARLLKEAVDVA